MKVTYYSVANDVSIVMYFCQVCSLYYFKIKKGIIAPIYEERLRQMGEWLKINGDGKKIIVSPSISN